MTPDELKKSIDDLMARVDDAGPQQGRICHQLGASFLTLAAYEDEAANLGYAIEAYNQALERYPVETYPHEHATLQNERGMAYRKLAMHIDPLANLNRAIICHRVALKQLDHNSDEYARTQTHLGNAHQTISYAGEMLPNLFRAIDAYEKALALMPPDHTDYAATQNNLGLTYARLAQVNDKRGNLERAIAAHLTALATYTPTDHPRAYAQTQRNLGIAYEDIGNPAAAQDAWQAAINCYQQLGDADAANELQEWIRNVVITEPPPPADSPQILRNLLSSVFNRSNRTT